jgi:hypothetical protein
LVTRFIAAQVSRCRGMQVLEPGVGVFGDRNLIRDHPGEQRADLRPPLAAREPIEQAVRVQSLGRAFAREQLAPFAEAFEKLDAAADGIE